MTERTSIVEKNIPLVVNKIETLKVYEPEVFFSSGSTLLDLVLGGGWAMRRIFNIIGDRSVGKTWIAIEAFANFSRTFSNPRMRYAESEAALNESFADRVGLPPNVTRPDELLNTVEEFRDDLDDFIKGGGPGLYVLDSLDALSDDAEMKKFEDRSDAGSYGTGKAKGMSALFRLLARDIKKQNCCLGIISQVRENIGVTFGEQYGRSGGKALDFYASHTLWLHNAGKEDKTFEGDSRVTGIKVIAKCKKNKIGLPFRDCAFSIMFDYGIDSELSCLDWLVQQKKMDKETGKSLEKQIKKARQEQDFKTLDELSLQLKQDAAREWKRIEDSLRFPIRK